MGKIVYIMGKSSAGKDTFFGRLEQDASLQLKTVTMYSTRPMRDGEQEGREYFFRDTDFFEQAKAEEKVIESRTYHTIKGPWTYFTMDDGQIDLEKGNYIMIGTLESYVNMKKYYESKGVDALFPIYIQVEDGERLLRAIRREQTQKEPAYEEMCRRFLADAEDFSEENLQKAGIRKRYENVDFEACLSEILRDIRGLSEM